METQYLMAIIFILLVMVFFQAGMALVPDSGVRRRVRLGSIKGDGRWEGKLLAFPCKTPAKVYLNGNRAIQWSYEKIWWRLVITVPSYNTVPLKECEVTVEY